MIEAAALKFPRVANSQLGPGATIEYKTPAGGPAGSLTLAYIDYSEDGTRAAVTVFTPDTNGERRYKERPAGRALQIVMNHCRKQGFSVPDFDSIEDGTAAAALQHAGATSRAADEAAVDESPADVEAAAQLPLPATVPAGTMGPFPAPPAPVNIPAGLPAYVPATTAPAPPQPGETAGEWQGRVQEHFAGPAAVEPAPEFRSVAEAADAVLGEPADDIVRHWISRGGTIYQLHLRAIVPASETADALRDFVENDAHGYTRSSDGRIYLWSSHCWNVGYAVVLPA